MIECPSDGHPGGMLHAMHADMHDMSLYMQQANVHVQGLVYTSGTFRIPPGTFPGTFRELSRGIPGGEGT